MSSVHLRRRLALVLGLACLGGGLALTPVGADSSPATPPAKLDPLASFTVPPGWTLERVAGPPLVVYPMLACFDERGRLFLAESAGRNLNAGELLKDPPNFIRVLEDTDGDGRFDRGTVFADKLTSPMGVLPHEGAVYTAAAPSIWRLRDTTGKGVADRRDELVTKFGFTGNAADIHGPFLGPDGWLYWTDGRHGHEIKRSDGSIMKGLAARIFRCRPDGSDVEVVCGGGMDDPVEIAFTPEGEALATVDIFESRPERIDALIHCVEGGVFPYNDVYKEFKSTGDLLPAVAPLGWVAPAGLMRRRGGAGDEWFSAQFNRHRIQRHVLQRDGATFRAGAEDWLVSSDPDFHPTDVLEDADGSILVIDTGGWFRIGCPTSRLAKPDVKGAVYRLRRQDAPRVEDPRGLALDWDHLEPRRLAELLDDPRFAVRDRAVATLARRGRPALADLRKVLAEARSLRARRNAVWALTRMTDAEARAALRPALEDRAASVRLSAAHGLGLNRDAEALPVLARLVVKDPDAAVRREAATALGRLRRPAAVPALFDGVRGGGDRFLEHALIYALIVLADGTGTRQGLRDPSPVVRRAALLALDQMEGGRLTREEVTPLLDTGDPALQQAALAIMKGHAGWAKETVGLLSDWLSQEKLDERRQESLRGALLAFCAEQPVQDLVARALHDDRTPPPARLLLLETIGRAPLAKLPAAWVAELGRALEGRDERIVRQTVVALRTTQVADFDDALLRLGRERGRPVDLRLAALAAVAPRLARMEAADFRFLQEHLGQDQPPLDRLAAAQALGAAHLDDDQSEALTGALAQAGALELPHLLAAYEHGTSAAVGRKLLAALGRSPGLPAVAPDVLRRTLQGYPAEVRAAAGPLLKRLSQDTEHQQAHLAELAPLLSGGDAARGREVFFGKKATCVACHTVRRAGGRVGPDLSAIGAVRSGRDLLEAVVYPSASFARGFEPYVVATRNGRLHTGILARETAEAIYLVTADRVEERLPRSEIDTFEPGRVSIMPQGLEAQLTRQELSDLLAFLQSLR